MLTKPSPQATLNLNQRQAAFHPSTVPPLSVHLNSETPVSRQVSPVTHPRLHLPQPSRPKLHPKVPPNLQSAPIPAWGSDHSFELNPQKVPHERPTNTMQQIDTSLVRSSI